MTPDQQPHVVFTGGGTGGHLFPGLAVAERLMADWPRARITFAGSGKPWERHLVAAAGFDYVELRCRPMPRRVRHVPRFLTENLAGYRAAVRFLGWHRVAVVVGLGGYTSVPMARAAVRRGVPLVLMEQNVVPGRATRWLAPSAAMVCVAFEQTVRYLSAKSTVRVTGNPVREEFVRREVTAVHGPHGHAPLTPTSLSEAASGSSGRGKQLLVLGGSSGARSLNEHVPRAFHRVGEGLDGWRIIHQSGEAELEPTRRLYKATGLDAEVVPFVPDMARVLGESDLAVCRAGGTTLAELAASGVPAVLLPYPHAADDHQRKNADVFTDAGGALTFDERELGAELEPHLASTIAELVADAPRRTTMSEAIARRAHPDATWDVATMIRHLA